jgi:enoyl-CoA hydratase/carnithine racemase
MVESLPVSGTFRSRSVHCRAMSSEFVHLEHRADGVVVLRLNRPPLNALSIAVLAGIADAAADLAADPSVKAVVVAGSEKAFAAGADINELASPDTARPIIEMFRRAFDGLGAIPRPVIAAVSGFALGGGFELALACDLRIAAESARLGFPEISLGVFPGAGGTQRATRLVGPARVKELMWTGRHVKAEEALAIGLVDRVVPTAELDERALEWAASLASGAVVAMGLAKRAIDDGLDGSLAAGLDAETAAFLEVLRTEDAAVGFRSFLADGPGKATFSGR